MKNNGVKKIIFLIFIASIFAFSFLNISAQEQPKYKILILYNYGDYTQWGEDFTVAYRQFLNADPNYKFIYYVHNLDIGNDDPKKSSNYEHAVKIVSRYDYDLVISMHATAGRFAKYQKSNIFKDIPVIYVLPDQDLIKDSKTDNNSYVVKSDSETAIKKTIDVIPECFPKNTGIIFVSGAGISDSYYLSIARKLADKLDVSAHYIIGESVPDIVRYINQQDKNKIVFFLTYSQDLNGKSYLSDNVVKQISDEVSLPIFGFIGSFLEFGILGGNLTSAKHYAEKTAVKTRNILGFKKDENLNLDDMSSKYFFNGVLLKKYGVNKDVLPKESIIVNKIEEDLIKYFPYLIAAVIVLTVQLLFVIFLSISRSKLKSAETFLKNERDYSKKINETSPIGIVTADSEGKITYANHEAERILELSQSSIETRVYNDPDWKITEYDGSPFLEEKLPFNQVKANKEPVYNICHAIVSPNGNMKYLSINASPILEKDSKFQGMLAIIQDSTDDVRRKDTIKKSLREKETLLRELYHRTKNNMQTICSLLNLQNRYSESKEVKEQLQEAANRINSMALVHNKLYQSNDLSNIPMKDYVEDLINLIRDSYHTLVSDIYFDLDLENFPVEIDMAIQIGLIVNELISNAIKHAFPENIGTIIIKMYYDNENIIHLLVRDDGIGLSKDYDFFNTRSIGLQTVTNIVKSQRGGEINFNVDNGLSCEMKFEYNIQKKNFLNKI